MDAYLRIRRGETWAMCAAVAVVLWMGAPSNARACSPIPVSVQPAADRVPLEGPIVAGVSCTLTDFCRTAEPTPDVTWDGEVIEGTWSYVRSEAQLFMAWVPDTSLQDGRTYRVTFSEALYAGAGLEGFEVTADSAVHWEAPALASANALLDAAREPVGESFCCDRGYVCGGDGACFTEQAVLRARLRIDDGFEPPPLFVYRLRWESAEGTDELTPWRQYPEGLHVVFEQSAGPYCATLEARNLLDDTRHQQELCAENGSALAFGERVAPSWELDPEPLGFCVVPPGLEEGCDPYEEDTLCAVRSQVLIDAWCEARSGGCDQGHTGMGCLLLRAYCTDDRSEQDAGWPDAGPVADAGQSDAGPVADAGPPHADSGSCAVASDGSSDMTAALWLLAWLIIRVRRRAAHSVQ